MRIRSFHILEHLVSLAFTVAGIFTGDKYGCADFFSGLVQQPTGSPLRPLRPAGPLMWPTGPLMWPTGPPLRPLRPAGPSVRPTGPLMWPTGPSLRPAGPYGVQGPPGLWQRPAGPPRPQPSQPGPTGPPRPHGPRSGLESAAGDG